MRGTFLACGGFPRRLSPKIPIISHPQNLKNRFSKNTKSKNFICGGYSHI